MRCLWLLIFLGGLSPAFPQAAPPPQGRPLVITDAIGLPVSSAQLLLAATRAWPYSFGQEPGARIVAVDTTAGKIMGVARVNFRSSALGSREATLGVISYEILIEAENGQCRVRIGHLVHTGNRNAPQGPVDIGVLFAGDRPLERIAGVSMASANRLHADMRTQAQAHIAEVLKRFFAALRRAANAPE